VPVVETVAVRTAASASCSNGSKPCSIGWPRTACTPCQPGRPTLRRHPGTQREVRRILAAVGYASPLRKRALARLDALAMHPFAGPVVLAALLFLIFQAVFSWAAAADGTDRRRRRRARRTCTRRCCPGALRSLLVDGVIAGVGSVLVFLPQILILFFFILVLEDSGYLPRAAYLLDRLMGASACRGARSSRCCRASPARCPASWRRARSRTCATGSRRS
jgi:ferrous iron transport protein B